MIRLLLLLIAGLALLVGGCRQTPTDTDADVIIDVVEDQTTGHVVGPGVLTIRLTTPGGAPIADATVEARGDMAHAGMVPSLAQVTPGETLGEYVAALEWTMAGDWYVTVTVTLPDGGVATAEFPVRVAAK
jgi:hypothetical protein